MAPQFVKPYVKTNKNDAADAEAICEAVARPNMRFVPIKNIEQQSVLSLHRVRQGFVKARTAQANQIRGLLSEFGLIIPQGIGPIANRVPELIEDASN
jgi:transposase